MSPLPLPEASEEIFLTKSQDMALKRLEKIAVLAGCDLQIDGIRPRLNPLLVGASGSGKTAVIRILAKRMGVEMCAMNASGWIVQGARAGEPTLNGILEFVRKNERGIICLDEIDKLASEAQTFESPWHLGVMGELILIADRDQRLAVYGWAPQDIQRLKGYFLIAAGAWQRVARRRRRSQVIGFGKGVPPESYTALVAADLSIPEEIASRWSPSLIHIEPPDRHDLELGIRLIHRRTGLALGKEKLTTTLAEAEVATIGMRWLEDYVGRLLLAHPEVARRLASISFASKKAEPKDDRPKVSVEILRERLRGYEEGTVALSIDLDVLADRCLALVPKPPVFSVEERDFHSDLAEMATGLRDLASAWRRWARPTRMSLRVRDEALAIEAVTDLQRIIGRVLADHWCSLENHELTRDLARVRAQLHWIEQQILNFSAMSAGGTP